MAEPALQAREEHVRLGVTDRLQKYALRSQVQLGIHLAFSVAFALAVHCFLGSKLAISIGFLVGIMSSMSAASGALLAVTIALAQFYGLHITNLRDQHVGKLREGSFRTRAQMEKSAGKYPEISRHLAPLYDRSLLYVPGEPLDMHVINNETRRFLDWEMAENKSRTLDPGEPGIYDSFEVHLRDAVACEHDLGYNLTMLDVATRHMQIIETFSPLILGWATILLFTLTSSVLAGMGIINTRVGTSILIIPFWLFLVALFALAKDVVAVLTTLRIQELGWEKAMHNPKLKGEGNERKSDQS